MKYFSDPVAVTHGMKTVWFAPGDAVPEWAEPLVGEHVIRPEQLVLDPSATPQTVTVAVPTAEVETPEEPAGTVVAEQIAAPTADVETSEAPTKTADEDEDAVEQDASAPTADDQPDFTQPARRRTGARRKV